MKIQGALFFAACLMIASTADAQRQQLRVGDSAPELSIDKWIAGESASIQSDNVYVITFWATWCAPCRAAIPKLSELQTRYEVDGLRIIGISDEDEDTVSRYVETQGERITYTIAIDNRRQTGRNWMQAAGLRGIPASFIVDGRGRIQFIGNPHSGEFTRVLDLVMNGRYDAKLFEDAKPKLDAAENARRMRNWRQTFSHLDEVIKVDKFIFAPIELEKFEIMMVDMEDPARAYRHARGLLTDYADDPGLLMSLAEKVATDSSIPSEHRDLDLAKEAVDIAMRSVSDRNDPRVLAKQALIHYHRGDISRAVSLQRRAWMIAVPSRKAGYERVLRTYQEADESSASRSRGTSRTGSSFR